MQAAAGGQMQCPALCYVNIDVAGCVQRERRPDMCLDPGCLFPYRHCGCRGLQGYLNQRRKLLSYLRRDNFNRYAFVIHKLGLKDTYAKQVGWHTRALGLNQSPL
jgi:hypothetical protein